VCLRCLADPAGTLRPSGLKDGGTAIGSTTRLPKTATLDGSVLGTPFVPQSYSDAVVC
jgi:hypothetical protein